MLDTWNPFEAGETATKVTDWSSTFEVGFTNLILLFLLLFTHIPLF